MLQAHGPAPGAPLGPPVRGDRALDAPGAPPAPGQLRQLQRVCHEQARGAPKISMGTSEWRLPEQRLALYQKALAGRPGSRATGQQCGQAPGGVAQGNFLMPLSLGARAPLPAPRGRATWGLEPPE